MKRREAAHASFAVGEFELVTEPIAEVFTQTEVIAALPLDQRWYS